MNLLPEIDHTTALKRQCLLAFTKALPISSSAFYDIDDNLQPNNFLLCNIQNAFHQQYLNQYGVFDPLQPNHCLNLGNQITPLQQAFSNQKVSHKKIYQQFLLQRNIKDIIEIIIINDTHQPIAGISLLREQAMPAFNDSELNTLFAMHLLLQPLMSSYKPANTYNLTRKEQAITLLLKKGFTNKQIAYELNVEVSTIKTHLNNLFMKYKVKTRGELTYRLALSN